MCLIAAAALMLPLAPALAAEKPMIAQKIAPARCAVPAASSASPRSGPLASMPNATEIKALQRTVDGCPAPLVGRTNLGSNKSADADRPDLPFAVRPAH